MPVSSMAKPTCMKKTRKPASSVHSRFTAAGPDVAPSARPIDGKRKASSASAMATPTGASGYASA